MLFMKGERHHVSQNNNLGASPPLILGFHPSKRHAALIALRSGQRCSCFYLGITRTEAFLMVSNASYPMFVAWLLVDSSCFVAYHLRISCCLCAVTFQSYASSCRIELVAQRQHPASFMSSRSNLLWFALIFKSWRNIC